MFIYFSALFFYENKHKHGFVDLMYQGVAFKEFKMCFTCPEHA